ncbi:type II secretion system protein [Noviherbaspirillum sp. CPCC 100848]|uniref:Type II secretion system protein n=1 Tax=Noviherbaspirillum album TaxID=3080276 RepID=A0ABU6JI81_9BURK|nr:type II secretion system protein [Noviherbaspirillum sp. CPCC 100848]MEC4722995.1 type II secretion system protein [Noviherbaspirillum sp. CPCC 100848]
MAGFTLFEMVIVIALTGIIASSLVVFFTPAVKAYFDARRRAELSDSADTTLRRMARDIRMAVPNSIRSPNTQCFELLPTMTGGRYRMAPDTAADKVAACPETPDMANANCSAPLDTTEPSRGFDVLSPLSATPAANDLVVIGNQDANEVYAGRTVATISGVSAPNAALGTRRISVGAHQFPAGYDGGRFSIVPGNGGAPAVFYVCANAAGVDAQGNGTGTLYRVSRALVPSYPAACPSVDGAAVLATHVRSCSFVYSPDTGTTQRGFVSMHIEMTRENETVSLSSGAHVDNVP